MKTLCRKLIRIQLHHPTSSQIHLLLKLNLQNLLLPGTESYSILKLNLWNPILGTESYSIPSSSEAQSSKPPPPGYKILQYSEAQSLKSHPWYRVLQHSIFFWSSPSSTPPPPWYKILRHSSSSEAQSSKPCIWYRNLQHSIFFWSPTFEPSSSAQNLTEFYLPLKLNLQNLLLLGTESYTIKSLKTLPEYRIWQQSKE